MTRERGEKVRPEGGGKATMRKKRRTHDRRRSKRKKKMYKDVSGLTKKSHWQNARTLKRWR